MRKNHSANMLPYRIGVFMLQSTDKKNAVFSTSTAFLCRLLDDSVEPLSANVKILSPIHSLIIVSFSFLEGNVSFPKRNYSFKEVKYKMAPSGVSAESILF